MDFLHIIIKHKILIITISLILNLLFASTTVYFIIKSTNKSNSKVNEGEVTIALNDSKNEEVEKDDNTKFYVEVKGAVKNPGVYEVSSTNIINDVINLSGGFLKNAYTKNINLSKKVSSELVIYIYTTSEYNKLNTTNNSSVNNTKKETTETTSCDCNSYDISSCVDNKSSIIESNANSDNVNKEDTSNTSTTSLININTATLEELLTLNGIGESKAENIITYRTNCPFKSIEDIKNVNGIGDTIYEKIKDYITV